MLLVKNSNSEVRNCFRIICIHFFLKQSVDIVLAMNGSMLTKPMQDWKTGLTKHRNGMERNVIYRNEPKYTGTRKNDAGMKGNGQEWNRNVPERAGMTPKYTEMSRIRLE